MTQKRDILLLHGALGSKEQFDQLKKGLSPYFSVYDLNFEGHGGRFSDRNFSIDVFTENLLEFLQEKNLNDVIVFGYSMGGYVALNLALNYPEKVKQIITLGTKFDWSREVSEREVRLLNPETIETKVPHFAQKLKEEHSPIDWKVVMKKTAEMMLRMGGGQKLVEKEFERIIHPIRIGIGNKDQMVSIKESEKISSLLPNAELVVLEEVPHPIEKIDSERLLNYILDSFKIAK